MPCCRGASCRCAEGVGGGDPSRDTRGASGPNRTRRTCYPGWSGRADRSRRSCGPSRAHTRRSGRSDRPCDPRRSSHANDTRRTCSSDYARGTCDTDRALRSSWPRHACRSGDSSHSRCACYPSRTCWTRDTVGAIRPRCACSSSRADDASRSSGPSRSSLPGKACWSRRPSHTRRPGDACPRDTYRASGPCHSCRTCCACDSCSGDSRRSSYTCGSCWASCAGGSHRRHRFDIGNRLGRYARCDLIPNENGTSRRALLCAEDREDITDECRNPNDLGIGDRREANRGPDSGVKRGRRELDPIPRLDCQRESRRRWRRRDRYRRKGEVFVSVE